MRCFAVVIPMLPALWAPALAQTEKSAPSSAYIEAVLKHCDRIEANLEAFTRAAETVAGRHVAGGQISCLGAGQTLPEELTGRAGGMMNIGGRAAKDRPEAETRQDVMLAGWDRAPAPRDQKILEDRRAQGCYVIGFGPKDLPELAPLVPLCDVFFDTATGADDRLVTLPNGVRAGRCNHLVNALGGWVLTGELISALTRRGKMPPMLISHFRPDAREWNQRYRGKVRFHDDFRVPPVPAGQIARGYLQRIRCLVRQFQATQLDEVRKAARRIADEVRHGRKITVASIGHMPPAYVGRYEEESWAMNVGLYDGPTRPNPGYETKTADGALILRLGYAGMYNNVAELLDRKKQHVILVTAENPLPGYDCLPANLVARIDMGYAFGDACVAIEGYPARMLPASGIMQVVAFESINLEVLAP